MRKRDMTLFIILRRRPTSSEASYHDMKHFTIVRFCILKLATRSVSMAFLYASVTSIHACKALDDLLFVRRWMHKLIAACACCWASVIPCH